MLYFARLRYNTFVRMPLVLLSVSLALSSLGAGTFIDSGLKTRTVRQKPPIRKNSAKLLTAKDIFSRYRSAVVQITTVEHDGPKLITGSGSGFFFGRSDIIATAYHVVDKAESIEIIDASNRKYYPVSVALDPV